MEFLLPDRMLPLQTHGQMETQILEEMVYQPAAPSLVGHAVVEVGIVTLAVSETLLDKESIITVIFHDGAIEADLIKAGLLKKDWSQFFNFEEEPPKVAFHPRNSNLAIDGSVKLAFCIFICGSKDNVFG